MLKKCNNCGFQQNEFLNLGGRNYCKSCNSEISNNDTKTQDLINLSAHDKKVIYDMFYMSIEWLEKYIEIVYKKDFPDWESRRQIKDVTITRTDIYSNPEKAKKAFSTQMFLFGTSLEDAPILREDLKREFRQWISATKINSNCPNELKHLFYGFDEVMDGNIEKVRKDMANRKREYEIDSPEYMERMTRLFTNIQVPMINEREDKKSLAGKTHLDMEFGGRFGSGDARKGGQIFDQIAGTVAGQHGNFHFYPQKDQQIRNPNYNPLIDDPSEEFLNSNRGDEMDVDNPTQYHQKDQSVLDKVDNSATPNSSNNNSLGTVAIITSILVLASLGIYGIVKKSKKVKNK